MQWAREQAKEYADSYSKFLESIVNDSLDNEVSLYLQSAELP